MRVLGIMSGTSLDGVDYSICEFGRTGRVRHITHWNIGFPKSLKRRLASAAANQCSSYEVAQLHHDLGRFYALGAGKTGEPFSLVGLHGQTIFHNPRKSSPATLQIGETAYLREAFGAPVVSNFRAADLAAGGQGAPLATVFHLHVFGRTGSHVAVNNLGGISNVTSMDLREPASPKITAFDTGPANMLLDLAIKYFTKGKRTFDRDGRMSSRGRVDERLLSSWLDDPYFRKSPPKSTGRELFGDSYLEKVLNSRPGMRPEDVLATLTELTARSIALNYRLHLKSMPDHVILCGGGACNSFLFARITSALRDVKSNIRVESSADSGWDPQVIESCAFALLAWLSFHGKSGNLPETTGARGARVLGQLTM